MFRAIIKFSTTVAVTWCSYLAYEIEKTRAFFDEVLDKKVLDLERKRAEYIYLEDSELQDLMQLQMHNQKKFKFSSIDLTIKAKFDQWRTKYLKKLMSIALHKESECRMKAIDILSRCKLTDTQYAQLAQMCDARTAVSLARTKNTDVRYFRTRTTHPHGEFTVKELIIEMRDLLVKINKNKEHQCLTYFLSTTFPGFQNEQGTYFDIELRGRLRTPFQYSEEILYRCLKELVHYCEVGENVAEIYKTEGLQITMDLYKSLNEKEKDIHTIEFVKFIQNVSLIPNTLQQLFVTGWIKVLAEWLHHDDRNICVRAAHALANLDEDDAFTASYGKNVLLLHPVHHMFNAKSYVDVVFVHGLLGGALSTWRQRDTSGNHQPMTVYDLKKTDDRSKSKFKRSDKTADKYIRTVTDLKRQEWEKIGSDFEFVFCDFPTESMADDIEFTTHGTDAIVSHYFEDEEHGDITDCWPQDWLSRDYPRARVLSIDYNSRLSDWQFSCFRYDKNDIQTMAETLLTQLIESGVGNRPTVWVAHSMGGLILKSMLLQAWGKTKDIRMQKFHQNTEAIVFISTPHFGSHLATMFDTTRSLWKPSEEVNDLRMNSKYLLALHEKFKKWAHDFPTKVVSFTETRSTEVAGLGFKFEFFIVTPESGSPEIGEIFYLPYDHINICKPSNRLSFIYHKILQKIMESANVVHTS